jgi:hypothetical protein
MDNKPKNYQNMWMAIAFILAACFYLYYTYEGNRIIKSIRNHSIDTIYANDTMYVIKAHIDTSYFQEREYDPGDKPNN